MQSSVGASHLQQGLPQNASPLTAAGQPKLKEGQQCRHAAGLVAALLRLLTRCAYDEHKAWPVPVQVRVGNQMQALSHLSRCTCCRCIPQGGLGPLLPDNAACGPGTAAAQLRMRRGQGSLHGFTVCLFTGWGPSWEGLSTQHA